MSGICTAAPAGVVWDRCARIVRKTLGLKAWTDFGADDAFTALGADSVDMITLQFECEEEFGIHISDDEAAGVRGFGELVRLVEGKING